MIAFVEILQAVIALAVSCGTAYVIGSKTYAIVAILVAVTCAVVLINTEIDRHDLVRGKAEIPRVVTLLRMITAIGTTMIVFGIAWPAIPVIFAWGSWQNRARDDHDH